MIEKIKFGTLNTGEAVYLYRLTNCLGNYVDVMDYGCRIRSICIKDRNGYNVDVCLGYDTIEEYERDNAYMGAAIGRYANRIAGCEFTIGATTYRISKNEGNNHLHGGFNNFSNKLWSGNIRNDVLVFSAEFAHLEEGYPGNLKACITYEFTDDNRLVIGYEAVSDRDTIINLTNHTYFNLSGTFENTILKHGLQIYTDRMLPIKPDFIPIGCMQDTIGTVFDFLELHSVDKYMGEDDEQLIIGNGYDHNYVFGGWELKKMAHVVSPVTGIGMYCYSNQPGMQLYTGNNLDTKGKYGVRYLKNAGFCLETQNYPDSIHKSEYPSPLLRAGDVYKTKTVYEFHN